MANNIQLDEGSSGKYTETTEQAAGVHRQVMQVGSVAAAKAQYGAQPAHIVACTSANTDYVDGAAIPAGSKYVVVGCDYSCVFAVGEVTSASIGTYVGPGAGAVFALDPADVTAAKVVHVQSATPSASVRLTFLQD